MVVITIGQVFGASALISNGNFSNEVEGWFAENVKVVQAGKGSSRVAAKVGDAFVGPPPVDVKPIYVNGNSINGTLMQRFSVPSGAKVRLTFLYTVVSNFRGFYGNAGVDGYLFNRDGSLIQHWPGIRDNEWHQVELELGSEFGGQELILKFTGRGDMIVPFGRGDLPLIAFPYVAEVSVVAIPFIEWFGPYIAAPIIVAITILLIRKAKLKRLGERN